MIKGASPILNGLYPLSIPPFPGDRNPKREGLTNLLGGLAAMFKIVRLIFFALIVQLRISRRIVINAIED